MNSLISSNNLLLQWALLLLPLIPLPLMILANLGESSSISRSWPAVSLQARKISWLLIGLIALLSGLAGLLYLGTPDHKAMAVAMLLGAVPAGLMLWPRFRLALSRLMPIDPESPLHGIAVALSAVFVAYSAGSALSEGLQSALSNPQHLQFWDLLFSEAPFLLAAVIGVGFLIRRSGHETRLRLGLTKPSWIQALLGLFCAGIFFTFSNGTDLLAQHLTPGLSQQINTVSNDLFGSLSRQPLGIVAIALSAGIAEEIFFRGALQPRLGIFWTAVVFSASHTQYSISITEASVFVLALGLGILRRYTNTTTSMICHIAYDTMAGIGLAGYLLLLGLLAGVGLLWALSNRLIGQNTPPASM